MPFITLVGTEDEAQVKGSKVNPNENLAMVYNVYEPDNFYPLTGSYMTGGPSYTESEAVTATVRQFKNGRRKDTVETVKEAEVEGISFTVEDAPYPIHMLRTLSRLQKSNTNLDWHMIVLPRNCGSGCGETYYELYRETKIGGTRKSQPLWGGDITDIQSVSNRTLNATEEGLQYDALSNIETLHNSGGEALYGVLIIDELCDEGGICPYQKQVVTGSGGYAHVTLDEWGSSVAISAAVIPAGPPTQDNILSPILAKGNLIAGFTDVPNGTGTAGGILIATAKADGTFNAFTLATINGAASTGVNKIILAGSKLYAFGATQMLVSCDFGSTWDHVTLPTTPENLSTATILDAVFDPNSRNVFIAASNSAWYYNGSSFTSITAQVRGTSGLSNAFNSVQVLKDNVIAFGDSAGNLYIHYRFSLGTDFTVSSVGASGVDAILSDEYLTRMVLAIGDEVLIKQPNTNGAFDTLHDAGSAVNKVVAGDPLSESGPNYYLAPTEGGLLIKLASCDICIEGTC